MILINCGQGALLHDLFQFLLGQTHDHIFRFEVSVYQFAYPVQVVQTHQHLSGDSSDQRDGNAFVIVTLHYFEQVGPENLEYHHEMLAVWSMVHE